MSRELASLTMIALAASGARAALGTSLLADRNFTLDKGTQLEVQLDRQLIAPR